VIGVDRMIYMKSTSANDGSYTLNVSFNVGTDPDINTVLVQNRVNLAEPQLPAEVRAQGVSVKKLSSAILQVIALTSPGGVHDQLFLSNYATINIIDNLKRINGVGDVAVLTPADYSMRVWLNSDRMTSYGLTNDIVNAIKAQNAGGTGASGPAGLAGPAVPATIQTKGRLRASMSHNIVVRANPDGSFVRQGRRTVELGAISERIGGRTASRRQ
jgi:multidrug efflux pump subunit AcrB